MGIRGVFVKYDCVKCKRTIDRQISASRVEKEIDELREDKGLVCSQCWAELELRTSPQKAGDAG